MLNERFARKTVRSEGPGSPVIVWLHIYISAACGSFRFLFVGAAHCSEWRGVGKKYFRLVPVDFGGRLLLPSLTMFFLDYWVIAFAKEGCLFYTHLKPSLSEWCAPPAGSFAP